jgi:hypothetical protein
MEVAASHGGAQAGRGIGSEVPADHRHRPGHDSDGLASAVSLIITTGRKHPDIKAALIVQRVH